MSTAATPPSDEFMELLTDALRAGPGSPEWHQAVGQLRQRGLAEADEYAMLWRVRDHLASGKGYRAIRPGTGFTRKVMEAVEAEPIGAKERRLPSAATMLAIFSLVILLGIAALVTYWVYRGHQPGALGNGGRSSVTLEQLSGRVLATTVVSENLGTGIGTDLRPIGPLALSHGEGMAAGNGPAGGYAAGGVATLKPVATSEAFSVDATLVLEAGETGTIPQVFISDRADFHGPQGSSDHELVWLAKDGQQQIILPDGRAAAANDLATPGTVRIGMVMEADKVIVSVNGQRLYGGESGLNPNRPKYVGVRFLRMGQISGNPDRLTSLVIKKSADAR